MILSCVSVMDACSGITGALFYTLGALVTFCVEALLLFFFFCLGGIFLNVGIEEKV